MKRKISLFLASLFIFTTVCSATGTRTPISTNPVTTNTSITSGYTSTISTSQNTNLSSTSKSTLELQLLKKTTKKIVKKTITVYITKTGHKYHRSGCRYLSRSKIAISLKDAKAEGYGACSVCNPPA